MLSWLLFQLKQTQKLHLHLDLGRTLVNRVGNCGQKHTFTECDGSGLFQDGDASSHRAQGVTKLFDENDVNHMSSHLRPIEHLWKSLEQHVRQHSPPPSSKHHLKENLVEERCSIPPVQLQRLVETIPSTLKLFWRLLLRHFMCSFKNTYL